MREERLGSGPSRFKDPRSEAMLEPEEVSAIFRLNELGWGAKRISREYLIDPEGIEMAERARTYIVPTMQMTQEDLHGLQAGTLPCQALWKFRLDDQQILASQRLLAGSRVKIAYGTDCGMFPFSH